MLASRLLAAASLVGVLTLAPVAAAEDVAAAKALFTEGLDHMQAGRYEQGCPALRESYRLDPRIGTLFTLAECEAKWGRIATAVAHYSNFLTQVAAMPAGQRLKQREREKIAQEQKDALTPQVPELTLVLPPDAPRGTVVKRNGLTLAAPSLGTALPVDPGEQVITTQAPGGKVTEQKVEIEKGKKVTVTLEVAKPEPGAEVPEGGGAGAGAGAGSGSGPAVRPDDSGGGRRIAAFIAGGAGIAGLALGGVMGGLTLAKKSELQSDYDAGNGGCDFGSGVCTQQGNEQLKDAKLFGWISTIGFGVGVAGLGVATFLLLTEPSADEGPSGDAAARRPRGPSAKAGVIAAGPDGAMLGVQGVW